LAWGLDILEKGSRQMEKKITNSEIQTFGSCPKKWYLAYVKGLRPKRTADYFRIGSAIHEGIDRINTHPTETGEQVVQYVLDQYDATMPDREEWMYNWLIEREVISRLLLGYMWRYQDDCFEVIASELKFDLPIINPATGRKSITHSVAGKTDGIINTNKLLILENKTTSEDISPDSDYWKVLRIDGQISIYFMAALDMGYDVESVMYNVIRKPLIRPKQVPVLDDEGLKQVIDSETGERVENKNGTWKQASSGDSKILTRQETPPEYGERVTEAIFADPHWYYQRKDIPRLASDIEEARFDLWQHMQIMRECHKHNRYPRNTRSCKVFGKCMYFDPCTACFDFESNVPEGFEIVDDVHQELVEGNEQ